MRLPLGLSAVHRFDLSGQAKYVLKPLKGTSKTKHTTTTTKHKSNQIKKRRRKKKRKKEARKKETKKENDNG